MIITHDTRWKLQRTRLGTRVLEKRDGFPAWADPVEQWVPCLADKTIRAGNYVLRIAPETIDRATMRSAAFVAWISAVDHGHSVEVPAPIADDKSGNIVTGAASTSRGATAPDPPCVQRFLWAREYAGAKAAYDLPGIPRPMYRGSDGRYYALVDDTLLLFETEEQCMKCLLAKSTRTVQDRAWGALSIGMFMIVPLIAVAAFKRHQNEE